MTIRRLLAEPLVELAAQVGESPRWDAVEERFVCVDITGERVYTFTPSGEILSDHPVGAHVGTALPTLTRDLLLVTQSGFSRLTPRGELTELMSVNRDPGIRFNDAATDAHGNLLAGTMPYEPVSPPVGALYRLRGGVGLEVLLEGVGLSNGIDWSPDGRQLYFVDSATQAIVRYRYSPDGPLDDATLVVRIDPQEGMPDGICVDDDGCVWVALFGGAVVRRYTSTGQLDTVIELPVTQPTSCAFGGAGGRQLVITSATHRLSHEQRVAQPLAGAVFSVETGTTGRPVVPWNGQGVN